MEPTNGEGTLPAGINVRWAGYTIAPGCILPDGRSMNRSKAAAPSARYSRSAAMAHRHNRHRTARGGYNNACLRARHPAAIERATAYLKHEAPPAIEGQGGDNTAYRVACAVKDAGISEHECLGLMLEHYQPRCASLCGPENEAAWLEQRSPAPTPTGKIRPASRRRPWILPGSRSNRCRPQRLPRRSCDSCLTPKP
jgi:hypothetical protein